MMENTGELIEGEFGKTHEPELGSKPEISVEAREQALLWAARLEQPTTTFTAVLQAYVEWLRSVERAGSSEERDA